jgi:hypothetical protein
MMILCIWAADSFVAGWIWHPYHATADGRLFDYPVHLAVLGSLDRGPTELRQYGVLRSSRQVPLPNLHFAAVQRLVSGGGIDEAELVPLRLQSPEDTG